MVAKGKGARLKQLLRDGATLEELSENFEDVDDLVDEKDDILALVGSKTSIDALVADVTPLGALASDQEALSGLADDATALGTLADSQLDISAAASRLAAAKDGQGTIPNPDTNVEVTHGYGSTPEGRQIRITPTNEYMRAWYVTDIGDTTFKVNIPVAAGEGNSATFDWEVL